MGVVSWTCYFLLFHIIGSDIKLTIHIIIQGRTNSRETNYCSSHNLLLYRRLKNMKPGIIICPPLHIRISWLLLFLYTPTMVNRLYAYTSPGKNGVPMIYREKTYILPPVYFPGTLYCYPYSFLIIPSLLPSSFL